MAVVVELVDGSPDSVIDPSSLAFLCLAGFESFEGPFTFSGHPFSSFDGGPAFLCCSQHLEFLDDEHTTSMPNVPEDRGDFFDVCRLKIEELVYLHRVYCRAWLTRLFFFYELAESSHLDQIEMLKFRPPSG